MEFFEPEPEPEPEPKPEPEPTPSPDVVGDGPESLGDAGGSGQNCAKAMKHFVNL